MSEPTLEAIRKIADPDNKLTNDELVRHIERVFFSYQRNLEVTRNRVNRFRAKKKAEQAAQEQTK